MVIDPHSACGCNNTYTNSTYDNSPTAYTFSNSCQCCQVITVTSTTGIDPPDEFDVEELSWIYYLKSLTSSILYATFLLSYYVKGVARAPPLQIRCFDINKGFEPYLDLW